MQVISSQQVMGGGIGVGASAQLGVIAATASGLAVVASGGGGGIASGGQQ
jgi:hypothetical protein